MESGDEFVKLRDVAPKIMYELNNAYVGEMMKQLDGETSIFICSDHAAVPHSVGDVNPCIGSTAGITTGVMGELGYTKAYQDENGALQIDWSQTKAVFHRSSHIYINLKGRDPEGIVEPEDYEKTVDQLITDLYNYKHPVTGKRVVAFCMKADVSKLQNFKIEKKEVPLDKRQKITIALIVGLIICMLIPNFVPTTFWLSATLKAIGTTGIAVMFLGIAAFLRCDGEPYVNFAQLAAKGMPWDLVFMISTALTLAGALVSQDSSLSAFIVKNVAAF